MVIDAKTESRFLLSEESADDLYQVLAAASLHLARLPQQRGRGHSVVQTIYFSTLDLRTPRSHVVRVRSYPTSPSGELSLDPHRRVVLEVKSSNGKRRKEIKLLDVLHEEGQRGLMADSLAEVGGSRLVPIAAMEVIRSYYSTNGTIDRGYVTVDEIFHYWGIYYSQGIGSARFIGSDYQQTKVEVKSRKSGDFPIAGITAGLLQIGAREMEDGYLETKLRGLYAQNL